MDEKGQLLDLVPLEGQAKVPQLSKNQLKKRKRDEEWEAGREMRKEKRRMKAKAKKEEMRAARDRSRIEGRDGAKPQRQNRGVTSGPRTKGAVRYPVSFVIDCSFEGLMMINEKKSLASQITRCYSDNQRSAKRAHLTISSFAGYLKERFDGVLQGQYRNWKGVHFVEEDVLTVGDQSKKWMQEDLESLTAPKRDLVHEFLDRYPNADDSGEVVYLTSDSSETLTELRPHGVYIIGGLVDKNRHKGVCYRKAMDAGLRTAKLPIADYMKMNSRSVLTVNHVVEILLRWLECRDWGQAFMEVMPSRKGGTLKEGEPAIDAPTVDESDGHESEHASLDEDSADAARAGEIHAEIDVHNT